MKHLLLLGTFTLMILSSFAQSNKEDIEMIQAMYGKDKKAIAAEFIVPTTEAKKKAFWDLYDSYETKRKTLGQKRIGILDKYVAAYDTINNKNIDDIMKQSMTLQKSIDGLISTYYESIKKSVGAKEAAQFYLLETYLLAATRIYILDRIPLLGALDKSEAPVQKN